MIASQVTFVNMNVSSGDLRCGPAVFPFACNINWQGWLYKPIGAVNYRPAIIYLHGRADQGKPLPEACEIARFFTGQGYVVFAPLQRGYEADQTDFPGMRSTGSHIDLNPPSISYLATEAEDVRFAMTWLKGLLGPGPCQLDEHCPLVHPDHIAVMGHSFGGAMALLANALSPALGHAAAVDISGGVGTWNDAWKTALEAAIDGSQQPVYIFQSKNEGSLEPTAYLSAHAFRIPHRHQGAMFHNVPSAPAPYTGNAHVDFVRLAAEVALWGPSVVTFLETYLD